MRIIQTHEMADFDAVASLLGAYLLDEAAYPVLPYRLNRNVRGFITLYGLELPFMENKDLPRQKIELITLVDTQSLVTPKGMTEHTKITIIDHHPIRDDLPDDWHINTEDTGATTSILTEALQQREQQLSTIQASLLLLGIYEDTGSLTFARTTPRDIRAAAWLLEKGADLNLVSKYTNHPLSDAQLALYDRLRDDAVSHSINGQTITTAVGDAGDMDEELSTIAHRMRDLLDTDALFLLVDTKSGIQLVGRSTSDNVPVGKIAEQFGGGGHPRAAAARIKGKDTLAVQQELLQILPDYVLPALTAADLMSEGPRVLAPDTPVNEAAVLMQRYGYEGFPVVEDGRVVGLLTRREVDRTVSHKLNLAAREIMEAGSVVIHPQDTIETLQELMTDSGWGQVPVVDPETEKIIGIITRTDLLKTLGPERAQERRQNLAVRLENALPPARLALLKAAAAAALEEQQALYIVGGFVRDLLLDRPGLDFDLVVEGDAINLARHLVGKFGGRLQKHKRFGTAKWLTEDIRNSMAEKLAVDYEQLINPAELPDSLDLVTARREFYTHPTALPTVERGSIKLDLHRRDFTINTLALRLDGSRFGDLHDYWGGLADLDKGLVRVLHSLSFVDDPTRILRAVRFEQRFGFSIEKRTRELLLGALPLISRVSGDRVRHEFNRIFEERNFLLMLDQLEDLNVLNAVSPALRWDSRTRQRLAGMESGPDPALFGLKAMVGSYTLEQALMYVLWLMDNNEKERELIGIRLRLSGWLLEAAGTAGVLYQKLPYLVNARASEVVDALSNIPPLALFAVSAIVNSDEDRLIVNYLKKWKNIKPFTSGKELRMRGFKPGPFFSRTLKQLRDAWLNGEISTAEQEQALLEKLLTQYSEEGEKPGNHQ